MSVFKAVIHCCAFSGQPQHRACRLDTLPEEQTTRSMAVLFKRRCTLAFFILLFLPSFFFFFSFAFSLRFQSCSCSEMGTAQLLLLLGTRWRHARQHPSRQLRERSTTAASHPHFDEARLKPRAAAPPPPLAARAAGGRAALGQRRRRRTSSGGTTKAAPRPSGQSADPPALSRPPAALATVMSAGRRRGNGGGGPGNAGGLTPRREHAR